MNTHKNARLTCRAGAIWSPPSPPSATSIATLATWGTSIPRSSVVSCAPGIASPATDVITCQAPGVVPQGDLLRGTRQAHAAPLAGEGDEEFVAALPATCAGEAMGEDAAGEIAAELALDVEDGLRRSTHNRARCSPERSKKGSQYS